MGQLEVALFIGRLSADFYVGIENYSYEKHSNLNNFYQNVL
jgi:hypothetical protein